MRNENIKETNSMKFLRIIVDNTLKWHEHISYINNKISRAMGIYNIRCCQSLFLVNELRISCAQTWQCKYNVCV